MHNSLRMNIYVNLVVGLVVLSQVCMESTTCCPLTCLHGINHLLSFDMSSWNQPLVVLWHVFIEETTCCSLTSLHGINHLLSSDMSARNQPLVVLWQVCMESTTCSPSRLYIECFISIWNWYWCKLFFLVYHFSYTGCSELCWWQFYKPDSSYNTSRNNHP